MSVTHKQTLAVAGGANTVSGSFEETGSVEINLDQNYPGSTSGTLLSVAFTTAGLQSIILVASQNLTIKTNSNSVPDNTINLIAGVPFVWSRSAGYFSNPFSADVTAFYITCTPAARLRAKVLKA